MNVKQIEKNLGESEKLSSDAIVSQFKFLEGKILTIAEASFSDKDQRKAVKDLVKVAFSDQMQYVLQLCYPEIHMLTSDQARSTLDLESTMKSQIKENEA